jgi:hypothetical protein
VGFRLVPWFKFLYAGSNKKCLSISLPNGVRSYVELSCRETSPTFNSDTSAIMRSSCGLKIKEMRVLWKYRRERKQRSRQVLIPKSYPTKCEISSVVSQRPFGLRLMQWEISPYRGWCQEKGGNAKPPLTHGLARCTCK